MGLSRSEQMSRIRGSNTGPEKLLRNALWKRGFRYRKNYRLPVAKADLVFLRHRVAIFIDGCFWHGCPDHYVRPRSRSEFWEEKLRENVLRDRRQTLKLEEVGWRVVRVWEHQVFTDLAGVVDRIEASLSSAKAESLPEWRVIRVVPLPCGDDMEQRDLVDLRDENLVQSLCRKRDTSKW